MTEQCANTVLYLWRIECRLLSFNASAKTKFSLHSASASQFDEKQIVAEIKTRFTPAWWDGVLITDVAYIGQLHMIDGRALYEQE